MVCQLGWIDQNLKLLLFSPDDHDLRNSRYSQQSRTNHPVSETTHFHRGGRLSRHRKHHDLTHRGRDGAEQRRRDSLRHSYLLQLFSDELTSAKNVGAELELDEDQRDANRGVGTDAKHACSAIHSRLDRQRYKGFDL